jgi:hypothetical protein
MRSFLAEAAPDWDASIVLWGASPSLVSSLGISMEEADGSPLGKRKEKTEQWGVVLNLE